YQRVTSGSSLSLPGHVSCIGLCPHLYIYPTGQPIGTIPWRARGSGAGMEAGPTGAPQDTLGF
ncbi:unnamed protein product, partial [marine sediment metagenome]